MRAECPNYLNSQVKTRIATLSSGFESDESEENGNFIAFTVLVESGIIVNESEHGNLFEEIFWWGWWLTRSLKQTF